jgi:hypothetical protein
MAISLEQIRKQTLHPPRITVYGDAGIGKTEFFMHSPNPIFILTEDGLGKREVSHFPLCQSFTAFMECLAALEGEHDFKTVVIDSADALGFGAGYTEAAMLFGEVIAKLVNLRDNKGMFVCFTAHSQVKRVEDPMQPAFDAHGLKMNKRTGALLEEFCDVILYATEKMIVRTEDAGFGAKRARPVSTGERVMYAVGSPAYTAKNRYGLPLELPFEWQALINAMKNKPTSEA